MSSTVIQLRVWKKTSLDGPGEDATQHGILLGFTLKLMPKGVGDTRNCIFSDTVACSKQHHQRC